MSLVYVVFRQVYDVAMTDVKSELSFVADTLRHTAGFVDNDSRAIQVLRARDLAQAAEALTKLHWGGNIVFETGDSPVTGYNARKNPYDFIELTPDDVEPHHRERLLFRHIVRLNYGDQFTQPLFGHIRYFDLTTIGTSLREGGTLTVEDRSSAAGASEELSDHTK